MTKLLFIAPHLSTGGLPQYLTKKIELLKDIYDIYLVEWVDCTGGVLVVTRNKIVNLIDSDKFFTLGDNKHELINIIHRIQPDIIHLEEIPEFFMDDEITRQIYTKNRNYSIVETSHDSSFDTNNKLFFPDKFMFVSDWQIQQYKDLDIPKILVEYPIEYIERPNREESLTKLGLDPNKKHVLHVGLYTSRKNQAEFFEYAKQFPDVEFHSLGNRAENFKWYWEPLAKDQPSNLTWWNERSDVDAFYQSMDLFLFTSKGTNTDKETMPLVIREAISYQIPTLIYNLPVYLDYFNKFETINYLDFNNKEKNHKTIKSLLNLNNTEFSQELNINPEEEAFIISTYPITQAIINTTKECIEAIKSTGRKVILTSHIPIPEELDKLADYSINDNHNILTKHTYYSNAFFHYFDYSAYINLKGENNNVYHGPTCYTNYYNGSALAQGLGIKKVYFLNYDYILQDSFYIDKISSILNHKDAFFGKDKADEGEQINTCFLGICPEFFLQKPKIKTAQQYDNLMYEWGSESNGLENLMYHGFKNNINIHWEETNKFQEECDKTFNHKGFTQVEYFTVLPTNIPNHFSPFIRISNNKDSRIIKYTLTKNNKVIKQDEYVVLSEFNNYDLVEFDFKSVYVVKWDIFDLDTNKLINSKEIKVDSDYYNYKLEKNGNFEYKLPFEIKPKVKIIHLLTHPEDEREQRSIESISPLGEYENIEYTQVINKPYTDLPPVETCNRPNDVQPEPGYYKLAPGHYGCFRAHTDAILSSPQENDVVYLFFECDAILLTESQLFVDKIYQAINISQEKNYTFFSFAHNYEIFNEYETHIDAGMFTDAHAYLIMGDKINKVHNVINNSKWDAFDLWVTNNFREEPKGFYKEPLVFQAKGYSLIDKKISETNIKGDIKL